VGRAKTGTKRHIIVAAHGIPLATVTTGGNINEAFGTPGCAVICWRRLQRALPPT
jgi:hypothetical protein